ncbi:major capsid protein [Candidatus Vondammii sp. HM_W22]|uniref:major capsid protein n=1 Tax=Candidatus Vondammii sp. HM_W22 TaxID=2687299 RepID=UPI002E7ADE04|nr:major capsid protein [Candidatus Vondammii sp. HM_W22]
MNAYDTDTLLGVVRELDPFEPFLLNTFFQQEVNFDTAKIDFDQVAEDTTLAPFVSPLVAGKANKAIGGEVRSFRPAYVKPKDIVDPERILTRRPGEAIGGGMSAGARRDAIIADILDMQRKKIMRRKEWMAAQGLLTGKVVVEGDDYPSAEVDFQRAAGNTITLTGQNVWSDTDNAQPLNQIEDWNDLSEAPITELIMDSSAYKLLIKFQSVKDLLNTRRGDNSSINIGPGNEKWVQFKGYLGDYRVWVYKGYYTDDMGAKQNFIPVNTVLAASAAVDGVRAHGAILDGQSGYQALSLFPKNWAQEDPAVEYVMTQSAPLMVPSRPNASLAITVA